MSDDIIITDSAKQQISVLSARNQGHFVRLGITSGGCNGFSKTWSFDQVANNDDLRFTCGDTDLLIDAMSFEILKGSTVDYTSNLMGNYFTITIPTATSSCGCGTSFSI